MGNNNTTVEELAASSKKVLYNAGQKSRPFQCICLLEIKIDSQKSLLMTAHGKKVFSAHLKFDLKYIDALPFIMALSPLSSSLLIPWWQWLRQAD